MKRYLNQMISEVIQSVTIGSCSKEYLKLVAKGIIVFSKYCLLLKRQSVIDILIKLKQEKDYELMSM